MVFREELPFWLHIQSYNTLHLSMFFAQDVPTSKGQWMHVYVCVWVCCSRQGISVNRYTKLWGQHFYGIIWKTLIRHLGFPGSSVGFNRWVRKIPWRRKWQPTPYSCLENPMDRGAWRATVYGITRVGHDLVTKPPPKFTRWITSSSEQILILLKFIRKLLHHF